MKEAYHNSTLDVQRSMLAAASCHVEVTPWRDEVGFDVRLVKCPLNAVACQGEASSEAWSVLWVFRPLLTPYSLLIFLSSDH
jgi:hypothetical protein